MFEITLCAMGRLKEPFYLSAAAEYEKRLSGFCRFRILELPEERLPQDPTPAQIAGALEKEAAALFSRLPAGVWLCVLTSEGKELTSQGLAQTMAKVKLSGKSGAWFFIGSSYGMAPGVKDRADLLLSMGKMTFPHHLARIMALEQLYRAEAIQAGTKYHK